MSADQIEALERLARLKEQGILTDEEVQKQKAVILGYQPHSEAINIAPSIPPQVSKTSPNQVAGKDSSGNVITFLIFAVFGIFLAYILYSSFIEDDARKAVKRSEPAHIKRVTGLVNDDQILQAKAYADSIIENSKHKDKLGRLGLVRDTLIKATEDEFLEQTIINLRKSTTDSIKKGKYPKFFNNTHINTYFASQVRNNLGNRKALIERNDRRQEILGNARDKAMASRYFKTGRNRDWEREIKSQLKDPGSFDHENTVFEVTSGTIHVATKFRAKNSFGALDISYAEGLIDLSSGAILSCKVAN
ncbi:hypothetical protein BWI93_27285 [Siphonobacter sp. BAB-5385]|uniref:SHOCT domain-containing protein n=1 Tax=Siphonobacter sp. BAB-5385 TaxID=1864822 RepID=UPI000B9E050B|nr:SHOCT domain-containing protein [Siphonobacter sp. BAB-5385]OZI05093.1 hypothetical protein BWI93_27285 [Siphonobacter sp. BAB-5385]